LVMPAAGEPGRERRLRNHFGRGGASEPIQEGRGQGADGRGATATQGGYCIRAGRMPVLRT